MKQIPDCIPDVLAMVIDTAREVSEEDFIHRKVLEKAMVELVDNGDFGVQPANIYLRCWQATCKALGVKDPYDKAKARANKTAAGVKKIIKNILGEDYYSISNGVKIAYAGAMVDFGGLGRENIENTVKEILKIDIKSPEIENLIEKLNKAESVLIVADKAGELVFDKALIKALVKEGKKVTLAVAAKPIFLKATNKDVVAAEIEENIDVVDPGTAMYGVVVDRSSTEFKEKFNKADIVIAKGEVNYQTLGNCQREIFGIFQVKCPYIEKIINAKPMQGFIASSLTMKIDKN